MSDYVNIKPLEISANTPALIRAFNLKNVKVPDARDIKYNIENKNLDTRDNSYNIENKDSQPIQNSYEASKLSQSYQSPDAPLNTRSADYLGTSLGTPVFADLTLLGGKYTNNITGEVVTYPEIKLATVLLTVSFASRIVKTEIQGRDGTVKEYIGQDDAKVSVQGIITGWNGHYPAYEVNLLNEWRRAPVSKSVVSAYLQNLGINNLVVESFDLPQIAGGYSYQTFSIECISDAPVELKIQ
jgi:hypothetical protein